MGPDPRSRWSPGPQRPEDPLTTTSGLWQALAVSPPGQCQPLETSAATGVPAVYSAPQWPPATRIPELLKCGQCHRGIGVFILFIIKKQRHCFANKDYLVKVMVFLIVVLGCESWTIKEAESQRIDAFELRCWRRLLRVLWTARRSNQSIVKEISPKYSLEGPMLKLKLQYFGHLMRRTGSFEKTLMLEKTEGRRRRGRQRWLDGITDSMDI